MARLIESGKIEEVVFARFEPGEDILKAFPWLKNELSPISPVFKALKTPLARIMIPKATAGDMSRHSGLSIEELKSALLALIAKH